MPAARTPLLFVCTSCVRDARGAGPTAGGALASSLERANAANRGGRLTIREVTCLNGCRSPCNVALRGRGRWTYRFSHCTLADVDALLGVAAHYWRSPAGALSDAALPARLREKLSARTPPP